MQHGRWTCHNCSKCDAKWQVLVPNCCKYKANGTRQDSKQKPHLIKKTKTILHPVVILCYIYIDGSNDLSLHLVGWSHPARYQGVLCEAQLLYKVVASLQPYWGLSGRIESSRVSMGFYAALCLNDLNDLNGQDSQLSYSAKQVTCADDSSKSMCAYTWQDCRLFFLS